LKAQLKVAKKIAALRKQLKAAPEAKKSAIRKQLARAKVALKAATKNVHRVTKKVDAKRVAKIQAKIAAATDPKRKVALRK
jgi:hypothetical protein